MKRGIILTVVITLLFVATSWAKDFEGTVTYKVDVVEVTPDASISPQMIPETVTAYIKDGKVRLDMETMMEVKLLSDAKKEEAFLLVSFFGMKYAMEMDSEEIKKGKAKSNRIEVRPTSTRKTIAGYSCTKANISDRVTNYKTSVYYAPSLNVGHVFGMGFDFLSRINGLPLDFTINAGGLVMHVTGQKVTPQTIASTKFVIPSDYEKTEAEQVLKLLGL